MRDRRHRLGGRHANRSTQCPWCCTDEGLDEFILKHLQIKRDPPDLSEWEALVDRVEHPKGKVSHRPFGKYVDLPDAYL